MSSLHIPAVDRLLALVGEPDDPILQQMEHHASREGFPTVGYEVGRLLRFLVHVGDVRRVFECGSGFGYSAYWMATALPTDGEIVLTEHDADELAAAEQYFVDGGYDHLARFEHRDALEQLSSETMEFDLILIDHEKAAYPAGLDRARERLRPGGVIVADNACKTWSYGPQDIVSALENPDAELDESLRGIVEYYRRVRDLPGFETVCLPLGEGIFVTVDVTGDSPRTMSD